MEPRYPAAVERIVDLGRFYDLTAAKASRDEVVAQVRAERSAYLRAYHSMKAARQVELDTEEAARRAMDWHRAERRTNGIIARELHRRGREAGETELRFLGSLTHRGFVWRFDTVDALCPRVYELEDSFGLGAELLRRVREAASAAGWNTIACVSPEAPKQIEHLLIPGLGLAFVTSGNGMRYGGKPCRRVRLDALAHPVNRARTRFETRMTGLLREQAAAALGEAREAHLALEAVYRPYVDFDGVRGQAVLETSRLLSWMRG